MRSTKLLPALDFSPENAFQTEVKNQTPIAIRLRVLNRMGDKYYSKGELEKAESTFNQILQLTAGHEDWNEARATALCDLAMIQKSKGNTEAAMLLFQRSLEVYDPTDDNREKAITLSNLAISIASQGESARALELLQQSLTIAEVIGESELQAKTLANMAAIAMTQGDVDLSLDLLQQALELAEQMGDFPGKAAMLSVMAMAIADLGETDCALELWQQSLNLSAQMGEVQSHVNTLDKMAIVIAQQGDIKQAWTLWQQSVELKAQIGDSQGQAATWATMAHWAGEIGDRSRQLELNSQAIQALEQIEAYGDVVKVLQHLGESIEEDSSGYFAQAVWLTLRIESPLEEKIDAIARLFYAASPEDESRTLLAVTAFHLCAQSSSPKTRSAAMLAIVTTALSIPPNAVENWMVQQHLNDLTVVLHRLDLCLETFVGTGWLFDRRSAKT
jgi:tetratricopeptide (TPR) repeat protein